MMPHNSDTDSSCRSSSSRMRLRVVSARAERWSRIAGAFSCINPSIRIEGYMCGRSFVNPDEPIRDSMPVSEPMTLATDYVLGTLAAVCAVLLVRQNARLRQTAVGLWALALA